MPVRLKMIWARVFPGNEPPVLYEATQNRYEALPRWLVEGLAGVVVGADDRLTGAVVHAAAANSLIPG
ncbi:MAG: hypothetical protein IPL78_05955 [Chloroflexi bacterium]|nr:hypothetical protein [Chloroflexota bacterium]